MQIGIDIDEVLFPFIGKFRDYVASRLQKELKSFPDPTGWAFHDSWGLTVGEFDVMFAEFIEDDGFLDCDPIKGSIQMVWDIVKDNHVTLVTARGTFSNVSDQGLYVSKLHTVQWLQDNNLSSLPLVFTKNKHLLNVDIHIDDAVHHLTDCRERGIFAICMDAPHNQEWDGPRAKAPSEVVKLVNEFKWQKQALGNLLKEPLPLS